MSFVAITFRKHKGFQNSFYLNVQKYHEQDKLTQNQFNHKINYIKWTELNISCIKIIIQLILNTLDGLFEELTNKNNV